VSNNPFGDDDGSTFVLLDEIEQRSLWSAASMFQPASVAGLRLWTTSNELDR
jgi:uncharacterized protein YbdZ (MbtH family)